MTIGNVAVIGIRKIVCLTGANGFVGRHVLKELLELGYSVRVLTRRQNIFLKLNNVEYFIGDLTSDQFDIRRFMIGSIGLINCAGELNRKERMRSINIEAPKRLFSQAISLSEELDQDYCFIHLSSAGVYGQADDSNRKRLINENTPLNPKGEYETSKSEADLALIGLLQSTSRVRLALLRPTNIFGKDMPNDALRGLIHRIRVGHFFFIGGDHYITNYVHVQDVARSLTLILENRSKHSLVCYNLSDDCYLQELVFKIADCSNVRRPRLIVPRWFAWLVAMLFSPLKSFPLTHSRLLALTNLSSYSTKKIQSELGFKWSRKTPDSVVDLL